MHLVADFRHVSVGLGVWDWYSSFTTFIYNMILRLCAYFIIVFYYLRRTMTFRRIRIWQLARYSKSIVVLYIRSRVVSTSEKEQGHYEKRWNYKTLKDKACTHAYHTQRELEFHSQLSFHVKTNLISHQGQREFTGNFFFLLVLIIIALLPFPYPSTLINFIILPRYQPLKISLWPHNSSL